MAAELSVIIVNWQQEEQTLSCLSSIRSWQVLKPDLVVVDNESTEISRKALRDVLGPDLLISSETNLGYAGGNNLGLKRALRNGAPFILLLNTDAAIAEKDVMRLLARMQNNPDIAILGPVLKEWRDGRTQSYVGGRDIVRSALTRQECEDLTAIPGYPLHDVEYVSGTVFLVRRSVLDKIGLLDEQFFFSGEIADLCKRAKEQGYRVCVDLEVEARHDIGVTSETLRDTLYVYYNLRNRFLYARKHYPLEKAKYFALCSKLCLTELGRALAAGRWRKARAISLAFAHAATGRFGNANAAFPDEA